MVPLPSRTCAEPYSPAFDVWWDSTAPARPSVSRPAGISVELVKAYKNSSAGSLLTRRWRGMDSDFQFRLSEGGNDPADADFLR
jgi:hypothetical protein